MAVFCTHECYSRNSLCPYLPEREAPNLPELELFENLQVDHVILLNQIGYLIFESNVQATHKIFLHLNTRLI